MQEVLFDRQVGFMVFRITSTHFSALMHLSWIGFRGLPFMA